MFRRQLEVQVITGTRMGIVGAIEADDVVVLIFNPDAGLESAFAGIFLGMTPTTYSGLLPEIPATKVKS